MLMKYKGIFIGFHNHDWIIFASSDPSATWFKGYQNSCGNGDPRPYSKTAHLMSISQLPEETQALAIKWVDEAIEIARVKIDAHEKREAESKALTEQERKKVFKANVTDKWADALEAEDHP